VRKQYLIVLIAVCERITDVPLSIDWNVEIGDVLKGQEK
jgi:hypothetical protein